MSPNLRANFSGLLMTQVHSGQIRTAGMTAEAFISAEIRNVWKSHSNVKHGTVSQDPVLILKKSGEPMKRLSATKEDMNVKKSQPAY
jgi:hypothetical protein